MRAELKRLRKRCLELSHLGGDGNLQSCFSSMEMLWVLYHGGMKWSAGESLSPQRDRLLMSKGQASLALAAVLEDVGLFDPEELNSFCKAGSRFSMQLDRTKFLTEGGVENSAGSLGHGFPMAVGLAYAQKVRRTGCRVYALAGDGEMNEGTMWEACAFAAGHGLDGLTLLVDDNDSIGRMLDMGSLREKLESFGFFVLEVDGHDVDAISAALDQCRRCTGKPQAVIAHTVRGYGSRTLAGDNAWFHRAPNAEELAMLQEEVDAF